MPRGGKRPGAGRPAGSANKDTAASRAALADLVAGHVETAIATLAQIAKSGESESARVSACNAILDRAYGRPGQSVEITDDRPPMPTEILITAAAWPITDEAEAEIEANRRPDGSIDFAALSQTALDQIMRAADLRDVAQDRFGA